MKRWACLLACAIGVCAPGHAAFAQEKTPAPPVLPREVTLTGAKVAPLVIDDRRVLNDSTKVGAVEMQIVFSHAPSAQAGGAGGLLGGGAAGDDPRAAWRAGEEAALRAAALEHYRELTGDEQGQPQMWVRHNDAAAGLDYAQDLLAKGYERREKRDGGPGEWAALFVRHTPPAGARLGEATRRITITFSPTISEHGTVNLGASHATEVTPANPVAGIDATLWQRERARLLRLTDQQGKWLADRFNRLVIRPNDQAAEAFAAGKTHPTRRSAPLWGRERVIEIELSGSVRPIINKALGVLPGEPVNDENWRKVLAGEWVVTIEDGTFGRMQGHAFIDPIVPAADEAYLLCPAAAFADVALGAGVLEYLDGTLTLELPRGSFLEYRKFVLPVRTSGPVLMSEPQQAAAEDAELSRSFSMVWRRPTPSIERVVVRPQDKDGTSYERVKAAWATGRKVPVALTVFGRDLPRAWKGGSSPSEVVGHERGDLDWPSLDDEGIVPVGDVLGTALGRAFRMPVVLVEGLRPGPKTITFGRASMNFDMFDQGGEPPPPQIIAVGLGVHPDNQRFGIVPDTTGKCKFTLAAVYDQEPSEASAPASVWVERQDEEVYRLPDEMTRLARGRSSTPTWWEYRGDFEIPAAVTDPAGAPFQLRRGDVIRAEVDGENASLIPLVLAPENPALQPVISFSADEENSKILGEAHTVNGKWAQMFPVGQDFWIFARYHQPQTDQKKTISFAWEGGVLEYTLELYRPAISMYRGGPFIVEDKTGEKVEPGVSPLRDERNR